MDYKVVIFGNKDTTKEFILFIHNHLIKVDLVVTIAQEKYEKSISGYSDIVQLTNELGIESFVASDYSLKSPECKQFFHNNHFELGISVGWQRLIPQDILDQFKIGIFGFHGSAGHLPYGRGRSPLNWSIIKGHKRFINNCFKYTSDPDAGNIHSTRTFEINEFDTIQSLLYKTIIIGKEQITDLINNYKNHSIQLQPQTSNLSSWYPTRTPQDGKISLMSSTIDIYNLIRGVTHPFPGAYLLSDDDQKLFIWEAFSFDSFIDTSKYKVGEVIEVFNHDFILKTVDGSLIIKKYDFNNKDIEKNQLFH
jgi:methionyl-tRNA formyltransferase